jgi:hypothetical protein
MVPLHGDEVDVDQVAGGEQGTGHEHALRPAVADAKPGSDRDEGQGHAQENELFEFHAGRLIAVIC